MPKKTYIFIPVLSRGQFRAQDNLNIYCSFESGTVPCPRKPIHLLCFCVGDSSVPKKTNTFILFFESGTVPCPRNPVYLFCFLVGDSSVPKKTSIFIVLLGRGQFRAQENQYIYCV